MPLLSGMEKEEKSQAARINTPNKLGTPSSGQFLAPPPFSVAASGGQTASPKDVFVREDSISSQQSDRTEPELDFDNDAKEFDGFYDGIIHSKYVEILNNTLPGSGEGLIEYFESLVEASDKEPDWATINDQLVDRIIAQLRMIQFDFDDPVGDWQKSNRKAKKREQQPPVAISPDSTTEPESDESPRLSEDTGSSGIPYTPQISVMDEQGALVITPEERDSLTFPSMKDQKQLPHRGSLFSSTQKGPESSKDPVPKRRASVAPGMGINPSHLSPRGSGGRRKSSVLPHEAKRRDNLQSGFTRQYIESVDKVSRLRDEVILVRDPNARSSKFHQAGFSSKPLNMKGKTDRQTGLIPRDQSLSKAAEGGPSVLEKCQKSIDEGLKKGIYAAKSVKTLFEEASAEIHQLLKTTPLNDLLTEDPDREYICNPAGKPVTADYDLLGIGKRKEAMDPEGADKPIFKTDIGFGTASAIGTIIDLNVQVKGDGYGGGLLFHHGAEHRNEKFTQPQGKSVLFDPTTKGPETISATDANMKLFDEKLKSLDHKGYDVYRNQNWDNPEDHRLKTKIMEDFNSIGLQHQLKEMSISDFANFDAHALYEQIAPLELSGHEIEVRSRLHYNLSKLDPSLKKAPITTYKREVSRAASPYASGSLPSKKSVRRQDLIARILQEVDSLSYLYPEIGLINAEQLEQGDTKNLEKELRKLTHPSTEGLDAATQITSSSYGKKPSLSVKEAKKQDLTARILRELKPLTSKYKEIPPVTEVQLNKGEVKELKLALRKLTQAGTKVPASDFTKSDHIRKLLGDLELLMGEGKTVAGSNERKKEEDKFESRIEVPNVTRSKLESDEFIRVEHLKKLLNDLRL